MSPPITIPQRALVVLCGPSATGKSTWSRQHFLPTQIIASDVCREMVSDGLNWDESAVSDAAFDFLYDWLEKRLRLGRMAVVDSTALLAGTRRHLLKIARKWNAPAVLVMFDVDPETCVKRDAERTASVGQRVIKFQFHQLRQAKAQIDSERWDQVLTLNSLSEEIRNVSVKPLPHERPEDKGPFDIIGDVHGCREELGELLQVLGYQSDHLGLPIHPKGRRLIFTGDLACGGPDSIRCWDLALRLLDAGRAEVLFGDHDLRFIKMLSGAPITLDRGLEVAAAELSRHSTRVLDQLCRQITHLRDTAPSHLVLDGGKLVVTHAAIQDHMVGKESQRIHEYCMHGEGPTSVDRDGWVNRHRTNSLIVHGHSPTEGLVFNNRTLNIDTGCVLGGALSALRWPERDIIQVPAQRIHWGLGKEASPIAIAHAAEQTLVG